MRFCCSSSERFSSSSFFCRWLSTFRAAANPPKATVPTETGASRPDVPESVDTSPSRLPACAASADASAATSLAASVAVSVAISLAASVDASVAVSLAASVVVVSDTEPSGCCTTSGCGGTDVSADPSARSASAIVREGDMKYSFPCIPDMSLFSLKYPWESSETKSYA